MTIKYADVAESADALVSGTSGGDIVEVQVLSSAPYSRSWRNWQTRYFEGVVFTRRMGSSPIDRTNYFIKYACSTDCYEASFFVDIVYNKAYNSCIEMLKVMAMRQKNDTR